MLIQDWYISKFTGKRSTNYSDRFTLISKGVNYKIICDSCPVKWGRLHLQQVSTCVNSLPNHKILDWSKLKAYADDKINVTQKLKFALGRVENIVEKGENAGYQHFLLFVPTMFSRGFFLRVLKSWDCVVKN